MTSDVYEENINKALIGNHCFFVTLWIYLVSIVSILLHESGQPSINWPIWSNRPDNGLPIYCL
jgi:hypothetical protein